MLTFLVQPVLRVSVVRVDLAAQVLRVLLLQVLQDQPLRLRLLQLLQLQPQEQTDNKNAAQYN
jgi:hypothetical protein